MSKLGRVISIAFVISTVSSLARSEPKGGEGPSAKGPSSSAEVSADKLTAAEMAAKIAKMSVEQIVQRMQTLYNHIKDLKGKFKQVYTDTLYDRRRTSYGYMYVKKPGMMRWNYVQPERKAFISDGRMLWIWEPTDHQAFRNPLNASTLSTGLTFLLGSGDLHKEFVITRAGDPEKAGIPAAIVLKLKPRKPTAQYDYLLFTLRPNDFAVTESTIVTKQATNQLILSELVFNSGLTAARFEFVPPADTRVIESGSVEERR